MDLRKKVEVMSLAASDRSFGANWLKRGGRFLCYFHVITGPGDITFLEVA